MHEAHGIHLVILRSTACLCVSKIQSLIIFHAAQSCARARISLHSASLRDQSGLDFVSYEAWVLS